MSGLVSPPYVLASASHSAELFRDTLQWVVGTPGVVGVSDCEVTQLTTPAMKVNVGEGQIVIAGTLGATGPFPTGLTQQGVYYSYVNAKTPLTIAAADPTNPRIDGVYAVVQDAEYAGSNNQAVPLVVTGTATPGATLTNLSGAGAAPASAIRLAYVLVPAAATSIVTADLRDARPFVAMGNVLRGVPAGLLVASAQTVISPDTPTRIALAVTYLKGGMTASSNSLVCPVPGSYDVLATATWQNGGGPVASGLYEALCYKNGAEVRVLGGAYLSASNFAITCGATSIECAAGDELSFWGYQTSTAAQATFGDRLHTSFSAALRSQ